MRTKTIALRTLVWITAFAIGASSASAAGTGATNSPMPVIKDGKIAYALGHRRWAFYQSKDGKEECPNGINVGAREQFHTLFPDDGKKRTVVDTYLMREADQWLPTKNSLDRDGLPFFEAQGKIAPGMNLDGKVKDTDFTSPDGEKGIDNQLFRAAGCVAAFRGPSITPIWWYEDVYVRRYVANRYIIEISGIDSLENSNNVTVKSYRGLDELLFDALGDDTGDVITPGGTQRVDERWGKWAEATWKGKIVNGVLITEPGDGAIPTMGRRDISTILPLKGMRFRLKLTPEHAEGLIGTYVGLDDFELYINKDPQDRLAEGNIPEVSLFHAIHRLADGYPDPKTGEMTAISAAFDVKFTQVNLVHPESAKARVASTRDRKSFEPATRDAGQ